jgi:hypothetical protein
MKQKAAAYFALKVAASCAVFAATLYYVCPLIFAKVFVLIWSDAPGTGERMLALSPFALPPAILLSGAVALGASICIDKLWRFSNRPSP